MTIAGDLIVRDIVTDDFRAAAVLQRHGIDFCCRGNRPLADACQEAGVSPGVVIDELASLGDPADASLPRFSTWPLDVLADYIEANHHAYVRRALPTILQHARKVAEVHGERHPEAVEIADIFEGVAQEMTQHMMKEERMLFPYIRVLASAARANQRVPPPPFGTLANPIRMMELEHESAGGAMARVSALSGAYTPPADACATFRVTYEELREFERDLHQHVHLENNILFPKALNLERR